MLGFELYFTGMTADLWKFRTRLCVDGLQCRKCRELLTSFPETAKFLHNKVTQMRTRSYDHGNGGDVQSSCLSCFSLHAVVKAQFRREAACFEAPKLCWKFMVSNMQQPLVNGLDDGLLPSGA